VDFPLYIDRHIVWQGIYHGKPGKALIHHRPPFHSQPCFQFCLHPPAVRIKEFTAGFYRHTAGPRYACMGNGGNLSLYGMDIVHSDTLFDLGDVRNGSAIDHHLVK
jgi:hypothetical protein